LWKRAIQRLEDLKSALPEELVELAGYPRLDPRRVTQIYRKLGISSVAQLQEQLTNGKLQRGWASVWLSMSNKDWGSYPPCFSTMLTADEIEEFLLTRCGVRQCAATGEYRRRVEIIHELSFLVDSEDFSEVRRRMAAYGGGTPVLIQTASAARFMSPSGIALRLDASKKQDWGSAWCAAPADGTSPQAHAGHRNFCKGGGTRAISP
jgi:hypothetical protein